MSQINPADEDPGREGLYDVGTVAKVVQLLKLPDGTVKVLVEGEARARLASLKDIEGRFQRRSSLCPTISRARSTSRH